MVLEVEHKQSAKDLARELTQIRISRRICCDPYDCMCHEGCSWADTPEQKCGGCQEAASVSDSFYKACEEEGVDPESLLKTEELRVEQERHDFYARMIDEGNEDAAFWTDR